MYTYDVIQIVDAYPRDIRQSKQLKNVDPIDEAQSLNMLTKPLGRNARKIAIVAKDDYRRQVAYQMADYETYPINNDRSTELRQFIRQMVLQIKLSPPKYTVLVSDDPEFVYLCEAVSPLTNLAVWSDSATVPIELTDPAYGYRPLEDLLPNWKIKLLDVRIDLENIFIGLARQGWHTNFSELIEAIRAAVADLGEVVTVTGYADFDVLNRQYSNPNINLQREFVLAGGESRYVINQRGKNTADMKIVDDIRTLVEHSPISGSEIDIICLVTMDRDFRHVIETVQHRGRKVVVLGLEGELSNELKRTAGEVRYLNNFLKLTKPRKLEEGITEPLRVFLCHSSNDKPVVRALYQRLCNDGIDPWLDEENLIPGQRWRKVITEEVRNADVVLVCLSKSSINKSGYVQKEIKFALDVAEEQPENTIFIIPVKLEECDVPQRLNDLHWVNLFEDGGYERLLRGIKSINKRPS